MWNGVYYNVQEVDGQIVGALHEMDREHGTNFSEALQDNEMAASTGSDP
jgi:hypothetical protein